MRTSEFIYGPKDNKPQSVGLSERRCGVQPERGTYKRGGGSPDRNAISHPTCKSFVWEDSITAVPIFRR
jgi:hypothetical protein